MTEIPADWAKNLAQTLVASGEAPPQNLDEQHRLALAWALKDYALSAWSRTPGEVAVAASAIHALDHSLANGERACEELAAVSAWVDGIAELIRGGMTKAIEYLDEAVLRFDALSEERHVAHVQISKIMALAILGHHDEAISVGENAKRRLEKLSDRHNAGKVDINLGNLYCQRGNYRLAINRYQAACLIFQELGNAQYETASSLGLADSLLRVGELDQAYERYRHVLLKSIKHGLQRDEALALESLALLDLVRGRYSQALKLLEEARQKYEALSIPQSSAVVEQQLGHIYFELNLLPEALTLSERALAQFDSLEMPIESAWENVQIAKVRAKLLGPADGIESALESATKIFRRESIAVGLGAVHLVRAELALSQSRPERAAQLAEEAIALFEEISEPLGSVRAKVLRAAALLAMQCPAEANKNFSETLVRAQELQLTSAQVSCLVGLGVGTAASGNISAARAHLESAIELFEVQRSALPSDDMRVAFLADHLRPYRELLRIDLSDPANMRADDIFQRLEQYRARALVERLGEPKHTLAETTVERQTVLEAKELRAQLDLLYRRISKLQIEGESTEGLVEESRRIEQKLLEHARRERIASANGSDQLSRGNRLNSAVSATAVRAALRKGEALVEYGVLDDELFACIVKAEAILVVRNLSHWASAKNAIDDVRFQVGAPQFGMVSQGRHEQLLQARVQAAQKTLYDLVFAPLEREVADCTRLIVVPSEQLGVIQFAALHDGECFLVDRFEITTAASAQSAIRTLRETLGLARSVLALGESSQLANADAEARFVANLFPEAIIKVGAEASAKSLTDESRNVDVIHLACHGTFRSDNPAFSALHLADSTFTANDAEALSIRASVVVLSACESGVVQNASGDEMLGLVRGFLIAGAARVVASLWMVEDAVTRQFMMGFYTALQSGERPASALRHAQQLIKREKSHPFYWAPFVLYGGS